MYVILLITFLYGPRPALGRSNSYSYQNSQIDRTIDGLYSSVSPFYVLVSARRGLHPLRLFGVNLHSTNGAKSTDHLKHLGNQGGGVQPQSGVVHEPTQIIGYVGRGEYNQ